MSESGEIKVSFAKIKRGIDARIPKVHKHFLKDFNEKEWDLEIQEVLNQLREEKKIILSGIDDWEITDDWLMKGGIKWR